MTKILESINTLFGRIHIDSDLKDSNHLRLLHISDTPSTIYPEIKRIIEVLQPDYIVHTGDIADNLKLELHASCMDKFKHEAIKVLKIMNSSNAKRIILALGNHDDLSYIKEHSGRIEIIDNSETIDIEGTRFAIGHTLDSLLELNADFYLYGHDLTICTETIEDKIFLNGISTINLIDLKTLEVKKLYYPMGTDDERLQRKRMKL